MKAFLVQFEEADCLRYPGDDRARQMIEACLRDAFAYAMPTNGAKIEVSQVPGRKSKVGKRQ